MKTIAMLFPQEEEGEEAILWSMFYFLFLSIAVPSSRAQFTILISDQLLPVGVSVTV